MKVFILSLIVAISGFAACRSVRPVPVSGLLAVEEGRKLKIKRKSHAAFMAPSGVWSGIMEPSGLAAWKNPISGLTTIYIIGDKTSDIGVARFSDSDTDLEFQIVDTKGRYGAAGFATPGDSQWESIAVDGGGMVFVLKENPTELHIFSPTLGKLVNIIPFTVTDDDEIHSDWKRDKNSKGEGLVLLKRGHILLLKEKDPVMLIEFGPFGDAPLGFSSPSLLEPGESFMLPSDVPALVPLHAWWSAGSVDNHANDLSEIAVDASGRLYALSDQTTSILAVTGMSPEEIAMGSLLPDGNWFRTNRDWDLPSSLEKPEGLAFVDGDRPLIALDDCLPDANCVFTLNRLRDQ